MVITKLQVVNFKNFAEKTFEFHDRFNVVIGKNGLGKSSVLAAAQVALGAITQSIPSLPARPVFRRQFQPDERRMTFNPITKSDEFGDKETEITCWGKASYANAPKYIEWKRVYLKGKETSHNQTHSSDVVAFGKLIEENYQSKAHPLPVLANFTVERASSEIKFSNVVWEKFNKLSRGYYTALFKQTAFDPVLLWLAGYDTNLRANYEFAGTREAFFTSLKDAFGGLLTEVEFVNTGSFQDFRLTLAIDKAEHATPKSLSICSDGIKVFFKMVAEIAFRCVMLNGYLGEKAVAESPGIVLIDELDIMLHPEWQRHVVYDLMKAFPKIQFIAATHSNTLIQSLDKTMVIDLERGKDETLNPDVSPRDLSLNQVAVEIMGVESAFSLKNEATEKEATNILEKVDVTGIHNESQEELDKLESQISDPNVRAIFKMRRILAQAKNEANKIK